MLALSSVQSGFAGGEAVRMKASAQPAARVSVAIECKESRIGKLPVPVPKGVTVTLENNLVTAKGPKGELSFKFDEKMVIDTEADGSLRFRRADDTKRAVQLHGLSRTLADNLVVGVSKGFEKKLQLVGVGYRASTEGTKKLILALGLSHPVEMPIPAGLAVKVEANVNITISGINKYEVGQFAAEVREWRKPEPYKGKGIRYLGEEIKLKEGKKGK